MNCFTHALPFLNAESPYFVVGCCLPDWLSACDRKCRVREQPAQGFVEDADVRCAELAKGIVQHHQDDGWFHSGQTFGLMCADYSQQLTKLFANDGSMRTRFIAHAAIEMLLDACLHARYPGKLETYYEQVGQVDPQFVENAINRFATRPTDKLVKEIERFRRERFLYDYETDTGVVSRLDRVLARLGLPRAPACLLDWLPGARSEVDRQIEALLYERH